MRISGGNGRVGGVDGIDMWVMCGWCACVGAVDVLIMWICGCVGDADMWAV